MSQKQTAAAGCGRCKPGRRCRKHHAERMATLHARAAAIVAGGRCPDCGAGLVRNLALAGWWQCGAYAAESHRRPEYRGLPACGFQTFTEAR
jgi:hypothetical protein